jgi:hypothetical protein
MRPHDPLARRGPSGLLLTLILLTFLPDNRLFAASARPDIPEPLRPWSGWVLRGHEDAVCPFLSVAPSPDVDASVAPPRQCLWPSRLSLDLGDAGGRFTQEWLAFTDAWVPLPGDGKTWPQQVRVDGKPSAVTPVAEQPSVHLAAGRHTVTGVFEWPALPSMLRVPPETGLVSLTTRGRAVPFPVRDAEGRVWLQKQSGSGDEESRLDMTVHRHIDDNVPLILTTRIELRVSGRSREERLGRALPAGFVPMMLAGPLPARLDPDGHLVVQARPGSWLLTLMARHEGPVREIGLSPPDGPWSADEAWVILARPGIRRVTVEGPPSIDPRQTTLPEEWKSLPAYLMRAGDALRLVETQRGDADPAPDRLDLHRLFWLDFDGGGFTIHDQISGAFSRSWRLEMPPPAALGRVAIGGVDQLITRRGPESPPGVEIRQGVAQIQADSRIEGRPGPLAATGWDQDFQKVSAELRLPPGWRLVHATGVDAARSTWISSWTLLDLFLVLVTTMGVVRLWGPRLGALALVVLGAVWIEPGAPRWSWVVAVAAAALATIMPAGRLRTAARVLRLGSIVLLVIVAVPFLVGQARLALYPALEQPMATWAALGPGGLGRVATEQEPLSPPPPPTPMELSEEIAKVTPSSGGFVSMSNLAPDPKASAQTGPGLPHWSWRTISLTWVGPVSRDQRMRLFLLPPWLTSLLAWTRVGLVAGMVLVFARRGLPGGHGPFAGGLPLRRGAASLLAAVLTPALLWAPARADIPSPELLDSLRERLLEPPDCLPACAASPRMSLEASAGTLRLRLEIHAAAAVAVPLPGSADAWMPARVLLDGSPAPGLARAADGQIRLSVAPGTHQILMEGPLPDRDAVSIPLPLRPRRVTARADGWRVEGVQEDGLVEDTLVLARIKPRSGAASTPGDQGTGTLPPFVRVERLLEFGLRWEVRTRVTRMTPAGAGLLLEVPLIPGESVTSAEVQIRNGRAVVSLRPDVSETGWTSTLVPVESLSLHAPEAVPWVEVWKVAAGPVWHVETDGLPAIHPGLTPEIRLREWMPWPGETLAVKISRPGAIDGRTLTIDSTTLTVSPGLRMSDAALALTARAGRGGEQTIELPPGAVLQEVSIQGQPQPIRQKDRQVVLPLVPGSQKIQIDWREPRGVGLFYRAPEVRLGAGSVNARTVFSMPANRWILLVGGPRLGPAVLFWSQLAIALIVSVGLGALRLSPLRWHHWFLLSFGLTQVPLWAALVVAAWLLVLGLRRDRYPRNAIYFNGLQLLLVLWTFIALILLFWAIQHGLLGLPEMQIHGNGSSSTHLVWDLDRTDGDLPRPWAFSLPLLAYRLTMLAWALWLALAFPRWLRWGWESISVGGLWRPVRPPKPAPTAPGASG